jgi:hypothetical protein
MYIMKFKKRLTSMLLAVALVLVAVVGYASAAGGGITTYGDTDQEGQHYWFSLDPPKGGTFVTTTAREKVVSGSAYFNVTTVTNSTGYSLYVNVRSSDTKTVVGSSAKTLATTVTSAQFNISYKSGYGVIWDDYRPSSQTDSRSTKAAYIAGYWRP